MEFHSTERAAMTILTAIPSDPTGYGRVLRKQPESTEVRAIVEQKDLKPADESAEINSGIYCFDTKALFENLERLTDQNASGEFYLTDIASLLVSEGKRVVATVAPAVDEVLGANTIAEMMHLDAAMRSATARRLMASGVTIFRPEYLRHRRCRRGCARHRHRALRAAPRQHAHRPRLPHPLLLCDPELHAWRGCARSQRLHP